MQTLGLILAALVAACAALVFYAWLRPNRAEVDRELAEFLNHHYTDVLTPRLVSELIRFQRFTTFDPGMDYPATAEFDYNFLGVLFNGEELREQHCTCDSDSRWPNHSDYQRFDIATFMHLKRRHLAWKNQIKRNSAQSLVIA